MDEVAAVDQYLGTVLRDYAPLSSLFPAGSIWLNSRQAEANTVPPYIIFNVNSSDPLIAIGGGLRRIKEQLNYTILVITEDYDLSLASTIINKVEAAISATPSKNIQIDSDLFYVVITQLVNKVDYHEDDQGKRINYYGGVYQFFVTKIN